MLASSDKNLKNITLDNKLVNKLKEANLFKSTKRIELRPLQYLFFKF